MPNPKVELHFTEKPGAAEGLISYRYKGQFGWIMIGAKDEQDAISEANRSLDIKNACLEKLQVWKGDRYSPVVEQDTPAQPQWTPDDALAAEKQGWGIFSANSDPDAIVDGKRFGERPFQLQAVFEAGILTDDVAAWDLVRSHTDDPLVQRAAAFLRHFSPIEAGAVFELDEPQEPSKCPYCGHHGVTFLNGYQMVTRDVPALDAQEYDLNEYECVSETCKRRLFV